MRAPSRIIQAVTLIIFLIALPFGCAKKSSKASGDAAGGSSSSSSGSGSGTFSISGTGQS